MLGRGKDPPGLDAHLLSVPDTLHRVLESTDAKITQEVPHVRSFPSRFCQLDLFLLKGTIRNIDVLEVTMLFFPELDPGLSRNTISRVEYT